jgi:chemotaxis signal transduction protein
MLTFRLGAMHYSIPAHLVQAICPLHSYTPIPFAQPGIVGVVSSEERSLVIVDVGPLFEQPRATIQPDAALLLVSLNGVDTGLLAAQILSAPGDMLHRLPTRSG